MGFIGFSSSHTFLKGNHERGLLWFLDLKSYQQWALLTASGEPVSQDNLGVGG